MIEKLDPQDVYSKIDFISISAMAGKIDELVDAVNGILDYAPLEMAMKAEPKTELERTRKALEIIKKEMSKETMPDFAVIHNALKTALEQKDN